jgi:phosphoglycolate phosphatase-like HAD superfamily hydrolase
VLVGDTPLDVAAARHAGARAVGVATGPYDTEQLLESGAHAALDDLSDTERVLSAVLGRFEDNEHGD